MDPQQFADARIVVAGGAGFLGSHVVEHLLRAGAEVVAVDNICTGDWANLESLRGPRLSAIEADICTWEGPDGAVDYILNFACPASPPHYQRLALETLHAGSLGVERLLNLALAKDATFLQSSTSEVYGDPLVHPQSESYWGHVNSFGPRSMYDESKRYTEALCSVYIGRGARVRIARIFNTYGPRMALNDGRVVPNFVAQALRGEDLTVYGDGSQTRSFCYVDDQVAGLLALAASDVQVPVNLGNPVENTIGELARLVSGLVGRETAVVYQPLPGDDPLRRQPDITRARTLLDWEPGTSLREGMGRTIESMRPRVMGGG